jgi:predicted dehydrogenase
MAEQFALRHGVPRFYTEFERMLSQEKPDVVHISTPPQSHLDLVRQAVKAGAHVFVEKPLGPTFETCEAIIDDVAAAGRKLTTGYFYGFDPVSREIRRRVSEGSVGQVVHVETFFGYDLASRFAQAALTNEHHWIHGLDGTLFRNVLDHPVFSIAEYLPPVDLEIYSWSRRSRPRSGSRIIDRVPDELRVAITAPETSAYLTFSSRARPVSHSLTIYGRLGTIRADFASRTIISLCSSRMPGAVGRLIPAFNYARQFLREGIRNVIRLGGADGPFDAGFRFLLSAFYDSILHGRRVPVPYEDILRVSHIVDVICRRTKDNGGADEELSAPTALAR